MIGMDTISMYSIIFAFGIFIGFLITDFFKWTFPNKNKK